MSKKSQINVRLSEKRESKLRAIAAQKEKTVTQLVEDWIDRMPNPEIEQTS